MRIGYLSGKYETNNDPSIISDGQGDLGGKSYGLYQFSDNAGSLASFVDWLNEMNYEYGKRLSQYEIASDEFDAEWTVIARENPEEFAGLQDEYVMPVFFYEAVDMLQVVGLDVLSKSNALQQVVFSRAIQYGVGYINDLFLEAADLKGENITNMTDEELIVNVYEVLIQEAKEASLASDGLYHSPKGWVNGSKDVVSGLLNRFIHERDDALEMLLSI